MDTIKKRKLAVDADTLVAADVKFVLKHSCNVDGCGQHFSVQIAKKDYDATEPKKRKYSGKCSACFKKFKLSEAQVDKFRRLFGVEPKILDNNFDELFE